MNRPLRCLSAALLAGALLPPVALAQSGRHDPRLTGQTIRGLPTAPAVPTTPQLRRHPEARDRLQEHHRDDKERRPVQREQESENPQGRRALMGPGAAPRPGLMR